MSMSGSEQGAFEHSSGFEQGEVTGNLRVGKLEACYEELFADVIEDGVITLDERAQLDKMADSLGLDRMRLRRLEEALQAAYEAKHQVRITEVGDEAPPAASLVPLEPATDQRTLALQRRVVSLEARIAALEAELEDARAHVAVDVDLSDIAPQAPAGKVVPEDDPIELQRVLRHDPRDDASLHALFRVYNRAGDLDRKWSIASALVYLGVATDEEREVHTQHKTVALIRPKHSLTHDGWTKLLFHPDEEPLIGQVFSVVAPAVLLGRLSAMRRDKQLPKLDPTRKQDPVQSTIQAVRCFSWAASILGMASPQLYVDPDYEGTVEMVPAMPPVAKLGQKSLSGRAAGELAFLAGKHLSYHREEHFVRLLMPNITDLEEVFLAALSIGNPGLPLNAAVKQAVVPIAKAIEPILEPAAVDRLRGHFLRFVEEGGRANLHRWAGAVHKTAGRTGLLLSNDLKAAHTINEIEDKAHLTEKMDDLLVFVTSDRYARLRKQIGIALELV
ncbi:MAG: domain protein putative component of TonB system [Myxococcaceae bacterium]|nr:domain protein putative component of TonB system [Myxococcaceae bacterium]